jgi:hypothetical protein
MAIRTIAIYCSTTHCNLLFNYMLTKKYYQHDFTKLQTQSFILHHNSVKKKKIIFIIIKIPRHHPHPLHLHQQLYRYMHLHKLKGYRLFNINEIYLLKYMQYVTILIGHFIS